MSRELVVCLAGFAAVQIGAVHASSPGATIDMWDDLESYPIYSQTIDSDFMEAIGATSLEEALAYTAGLQTVLTKTQSGDQIANANAYRLRGFVQPSVLRDGFERTGEVDLFNVSAVEVLRGPDALLHGRDGVGGVVNYETFRPTDEQILNTEFYLGSHEEYRWSMRASGPLGDRFGYSVAAFAQDNDEWFDHGHEERYGVAPVLQFKPFATTVITAGLEYVESTEDLVEPRYDSSILLVTLGENEITGESVERPYVDDSLYPLDGFGFLRSPGASESFRWGTDSYQEVEDLTLNLSLEQRIGERLRLFAGYDYSESETSLLELTQFGVLSAPFFRDFSSHSVFLSQSPLNGLSSSQSEGGSNDYLSYNWQRVESRVENHQLRLEAAYDLPVQDFWDNTFSLSWQHRINENFKLVSPLQDELLVPGSDWSMRLFSRAPNSAQWIGDTSVLSFSPSPGEFFASGILDDLGPRFEESSLLGLHQGSFFDEMVRTMTTVRYQKEYFRGAYTSRSGERRRAPKEEADSTTDVSFGISARPWSNGPFSFYFLTAGRSLQNPGIYDAGGDSFGETEVRSIEAGLKFEWFDQKLSGSISSYRIERTNVLVRLAGVFPDPSKPRARPYGFRDEHSEGMDFQAQIADLPIQNLRTVINLSYTNYILERFAGRSIVDINPNPIIYDPRLIEIDLPFSSSLSGNGTPEWSASLWTEYAFRDGPLKGLDFSVGLRWVDQRYAALTLLDVDSFQELDDRLEIDAAIGYDFQIAELDGRLQLNVYNLTDEDTNYGYVDLEPRTFRLSLKFAF